MDEMVPFTAFLSSGMYNSVVIRFFFILSHCVMSDYSSIHRFLLSLSKVLFFTHLTPYIQISVATDLDSLHEQLEHLSFALKSNHNHLLSL